MKKILIIFTLLSPFTMAAQPSISEVLKAIEQNNTTLRAARHSTTAEQLGNATDIFLPDPEVEVGHLWGNPSEVGNRTDLSVTQTFDIPTLLGMKSRVAQQQNDMVQWQFEAERIAILLEAKKYVLDAIYCNAMLKQLAIRQHHAEEFLANQKKMLEGGECNIIDYNNAVLVKVKLDADIQQMEVERTGVIAQLERLNGGKAITITADEFEPVLLPSNFEEWFATAESKNPALGYVKSEVELSKKQLALNKAQNLPSFSVGYISEHTPGEHLRGISLGVSIPLWSNRNKVKQAKAAIQAAEAKKVDAAHQLYGQLKALYTQVAGLQKTALAYRQTLPDAHNCELLEKALQSGAITQLEHIAQHSLYYESIDKAIEAERDYQKAYAELTAYDL